MPQSGNNIRASEFIMTTETQPTHLAEYTYSPKTVKTKKGHTNPTDSEACVDYDQSHPAVIPNDLLALDGRAEDSNKASQILSAAYAQAGAIKGGVDKFSLILDDIDGFVILMQLAKKTTHNKGFSSPQASRDMAKIRRLLHNQNHHAYDFFDTPVTDLVGVNVIDDVPGLSLIDTVPSDFLDISFTYEEAKKDHSRCWGLHHSVGLSVNTYFMLVVALARAQVVLGYAVTGEVVVPSSVHRTTGCVSPRCHCRSAEKPVDARLGILGVLPKIVDKDTTWRNLLTGILDVGCKKKTKLPARPKRSVTSMIERATASVADESVKSKMQGIMDERNKVSGWCDVFQAVPTEGVFDATCFASHKGTVPDPVGDSSQGWVDHKAAHADEISKLGIFLVYLHYCTQKLNLPHNHRTKMPSVVVQTASPSLPSSLEQRTRATRNIDLVAGYIASKSKTASFATPPHYAGSTPVCKQLLPLICLSRECASWDMDLNNVVPMEEPCNPLSIPKHPCSCVSRVDIDTTLHNIRSSNIELHLEEMLFGKDSVSIAHGRVHCLVACSDDDAACKTVDDAFDAVEGSSPCSVSGLLESNCMVFTPGIAGMFYTNLLQPTSDVATDFGRQTDLAIARCIEHTVQEAIPVHISAKTEMRFRKAIYAGAPGYIMDTQPQTSIERQVPGSGYLRIQSDFGYGGADFGDQLEKACYDFDTCAKSNRHRSIPPPTIDQSVSRLYVLGVAPVTASPTGDASVPTTSAGVQYKATIHVEIPIQYGLLAAARRVAATGTHSSEDLKDVLKDSRLHTVSTSSGSHS